MKTAKEIIKLCAEATHLEMKIDQKDKTIENLREILTRDEIIISNLHNKIEGLNNSIAKLYHGEGELQGIIKEKNKTIGELKHIILHY